jgi:hypothetical protein
MPRKPLVRGLSSILAGLRKMEDDAIEEELDVLRDIEGGARERPAQQVSKVTIEDSKVNLLSGFDDEALLDSEPEAESQPPIGRDGQALKSWKKKGQKRTTRRVISEYSPFYNTQFQY